MVFNMNTQFFASLLIAIVSITLSACNESNPPASSQKPLATPSVELAIDEFNNRKIEWSSIAEASSYNIYWNKTNDTSQSHIIHLDSNISHIDVSTYFAPSSPGEQLSVSISAVFPGRESNKSTPIEIIIPPGKILHIQDDSIPGQTRLTWPENADSYKIYWAIDGLEEPYNIISREINNFTHTTTNLTLSSNIQYSVSQIINDIEGPRSEPIIVTTLSSTISPPTGIKFETFKDHIHLQWSNVNDADSYKVYRTESDDFNYQTLDATTTQDVFFNDYNTDEGKSYFYWISATNGPKQSLPTAVPGSLSLNESQLSHPTRLTKTTGAAIALTTEEYDQFSPEQKFNIINKLLSTLYKGISASEFFDIDQGIESLKVADNGNQLLNTHKSISEKLVQKDSYANAINTRHLFNHDARRALGKLLAIIIEYPMSRDLFEAWMAYILVNTPMFSPATELDSADHIDAQLIYNNLIVSLGNDVSIKDIVFSHQISEANWRRFRSPEDNTREMIEIFLGLHDRDKDIPLAAKACKNWSITDDDNGYQLIIDASNQNSETVTILDNYTITTCEDFYTTITEHPRMIRQIITLLVRHFFPNYDNEKQNEIINDITQTEPVKFHDIFSSIIFSKEYLLNNERPKSFEEIFFNLTARTHWKSQSRFINELINTDLGSPQPTLSKMGQPTMRLKNGRANQQPLDSLSFMNVHSAIRDRVLVIIDSRWGTWDDNFIGYGDYFDTSDYIQYLFISTLARKASTEELETLMDVIATENETSKHQQAKIVLDYVSRLPEIYFYNAIN